MEKLTLYDGVIALLVIVAYFIRHRDTKMATKEVKTTVETKSAETQIRIDDRSEALQKVVARLEKEVEDVKSQQITTQVKLYDRLDSIDGAIKSHAINLHKVCQKVGVEWVDDVTVVKGKKA